MWPGQKEERYLQENIIRSIWKVNEIFMKRAWDLHDESIRSSSTNHYIYLKRAWYWDKEWMRSIWWKQGTYINEEESMKSTWKDHISTWTKHIINMKKARDLHDEKIKGAWDLDKDIMRSTWREHEI